jgi:type III secretion protein C
LVLSGMVTETKSKIKSGIPCLGGLPLIGAAFSESDSQTDKKNIVIFIRPHIINSYQDMQRVSENQEDFFRESLGSPGIEETYEDSIESIKTDEDE